MNENFNTMISTLKEHTTDTQNKMNSYVKSERVVSNATHNIQKEYHNELKILQQQFDEKIAALSEVRNAKLNSIDNSECEQNEQIANIAQADFQAVFSQLKQSFNIDNDQMCQILQNQTGLAWKVLPIAGKSVYHQQAGYLPLHPFGMLLVNENDENFGNDTYYTTTNNGGMIKVPDNETCYPAIVGTSSDENANSKLENLNWGHLYLYSKVRQTQKEVNQSAIEESEENNEETVISNKDISYSVVNHEIISIYEYRPSLVELVTSAIDSEFKLVQNQPQDTTQQATDYCE